MKIIDENGAAIESPDLTLGYLVDDTEPVEHPAVEKERQQAEEAARLPETIASLTCQLTDLQLALCELYEGGGV